MIIRKLTKWWDNRIIATFLWLGTFLYRFIVAKRQEDGQVRVIHFAASEREMNTHMREYVEMLDSNDDYKNTKCSHRN